MGFISVNSCCLGAAACAVSHALQGAIRAPYLFDIIKRPYFRPEDMDDNLTSIDDNPVSLFQTFCLNGFVTSGMKTFYQLLSESYDLSAGLAAGNHNIIRKRRVFVDFVDIYIRGFICVKRLLNNVTYIFGVF